MSCSAEMAFFHPNYMLQTTPPHQDDRDHPSTSLSPILPSCTPQEFHGVASLLDKRPSMSNFSEMNNHGEDELSDDGSQLVGEKKRRLNMEQVKTLEKNFELGNKLEPERKMQLARALGLQPRQIAIWFQNRRARWKTKQLERDYDLLKRQFDAVKAENDALHSQNQKLQAEILALKTRGEAAEISINLNKETEGSWSNRSENSSEIKLDISTANPAAIDSPILSNNRPVNGVAQQFFQINSSARPEIQGPKMDHQSVKEESLMCNMFCGMEDQTGFWPWLDQHNFN